MVNWMSEAGDVRRAGSWIYINYPYSPLYLFSFCEQRIESHSEAYFILRNTILYDTKNSF